MADPRGDELYRYKFSEILSAGAIPDVYADGWLPISRSHICCVRRRLANGMMFYNINNIIHNSSAWSDLEINPDPNRKIFVFMAVETCIEMNYPIYMVLEQTGLSIWMIVLHLLNGILLTDASTYISGDIISSVALPTQTLN